MTNWFSNVGSTGLSKSNPYIAKNSAYSNLTEKERIARQQSRMMRTADLYGFPTNAVGSANTVMSGATQFFSPQLSTDFLELPQSLRERREIYRHFYNSDPIVGQAIDLHTELPLSKIRLGAPKPTLCPEGFDSPDEYGKYILRFFESMCKRIRLFNRLVTAVHHYWLDGGSVLFAEDSDVEVPQEIGYEKKVYKTSVLSEGGDAEEQEETHWVERNDREEQELFYYQKYYKGWERLVILPIDQVKMTSYSFTDKMRIELIPSDRDRQVIEQAKMGDPLAAEMADEIPHEVREYIEGGQTIPLGTDPDEGSFVYYLAARRAAGEELGNSILNRCHLPGTDVFVERGGVPRQVPIETLDPNSDLVLTHTGAWKKFEVGSRPYSGDIVELTFDAGYKSVLVTPDHKHMVFREGKLLEVLASDIRVDDRVRVASLNLTNEVEQIDLASVHEYLETNIPEARIQLLGEDRFEIGYCYEDKPLFKRQVKEVLRWLRSVDVPTAVSSKALYEELGITTEKSAEKLIEYLKELGVRLRVSGRKDSWGSVYNIVFEPFNWATDNVDTLSTPERKITSPRYVPLTSDFGFLVGFYLTQGDIREESGFPVWQISLSNLTPETREVVRKVMLSVGALWEETPWTETAVVTQDALLIWLMQNFGKNRDVRCLPSWITKTSRDFVSGILVGMFAVIGDGSLFTGYSVQADQCRLLASTLCKPSIYKAQSKAFVSGSPIATFYTVKEQSKLSGFDVIDNQLFVRVSHVGILPYEGSVYSLNVHDDHTFFANGTLTCNCLRVLYYREKLRQAQTQIASRAMTPRRIVWGEGLSDAQTEELREQVDLALVDPDYSIVTNYEVRWDEQSSRDRLLDLGGEYEQTERQLLAGLGVTESLMSGEAIYSGDRLKLEVINTRYMFLRDVIQEFVEEYLFKPISRRKGFIEKNKWGEEIVLYPRLSFTRMPLRDSQDTYDALFNLYQKGSISIDVILDMFNIDPVDTQEKLEKDMFTVNDSTFNEVMRTIYGEAGRTLVEKTDIVNRIAKYLGVKIPPTAEAPEESRF